MYIETTFNFTLCIFSQFERAQAKIKVHFWKSKTVKMEDKTEQQIKTLLLKISYLTLSINTVEIKWMGDQHGCIENI